MFGHESKPSKRYRYGCEPPVEGMVAAVEQIERAHEYRNDLVRAELDRRAAAEAALRELFPRLLTLDAEVARLDTALEAARAEEKRRKVEKRRRTKEERGRHAAPIRELRDRLGGARAALKAARLEAFGSAAWKTRRESIEAAHGERCRALRANSSLYWGNYLAVEQAAKAFRSGAPPRFWRRRKGGALTVQLQKGLSVADLLAGNDTRLRLVPEQSRSRQLIGRAYVRVGSAGAGGREPVWCVVPNVNITRPLPPDGLIKWAQLIWRGDSHRSFGWELQLVISREEGWPLADPEQASGGRVGINLGWRLLGDGALRVAYWAGDDGRTGQLVIPPDRLDAWAFAESLRGIRGRQFDEAKARLAEWLRGREVPDWLRERAAALHAWKAPARLAALVLFWARERFAGDEEMFRWLDGWRTNPGGKPPRGQPTYQGWRRQDWHLKQYEEGTSRRILRWREAHYHDWVAALRRQYRAALIEDTDYRDLALLPEVEEAKAVNAVAARHRFIAAPGRLREMIREGFPESVTVGARDITRRCWDCKRIDAFDAAGELVRTCACPHCGVTRDQDERAALNLLDAAPAASAAALV